MRGQLARVLQECRRLQAERRHGEALELLDRHFGSEAEHEPTYWQWKGALLLWAGRPQEAEQVLRGALVRPDWPAGEAGITFWLAEVLSWSGRFAEVADLVAPWVARGDVECTVMHVRAMLALGKPKIALTQARKIATGFPSHVGAQLVLLETLVDLGADREGSEHAEAAKSLLRRLRNMREVGVSFNPYQEDKLMKIGGRLEAPFGFGNR